MISFAESGRQAQSSDSTEDAASCTAPARQFVALPRVALNWPELPGTPYLTLRGLV